MPDQHLHEDDAALYVLGGLSTSERLAFEARLAESEQLRALVRDLEEGAAALALAAPPQRPPAHAWRQIEESLSSESRSVHAAPSFWRALFRNGWAAAAACLAGWALYALFPNHQIRPDSAAPSKIAAQSIPAPDTFQSPSPVNSTSPNPAGPPANSTRITAQSSDTQKRENLQLRHEILELQSRLTNLSHSLAEDDAMLSESNRFKISILSPTSSPGETNSIPSPELQRAIFAALARQLGWPSASDSNSPVQFVDLRPGASNAPVQQSATSPPPSDLATQPETQSNPLPAVPASNNVAIPSLATKDGVMLAIGPSTVAAGSQLNITFPSDDGLPTTIPFSVGDNPTVLTVPDGSVVAFLPPGLATNVATYLAPTNHP